MSGFGLHHYAVAVRDLDEAAQTYRRLLGLEVGERGRGEGASLSWLALGFAGERSLVLASPESEESPLHAEMMGRAHERNPHGEGLRRSAWHADDPPALARRFAERTGRAAGDLELQGGAVRFDPRWTHGLPMILATLPAAGPRPVWPSHVAVAVADLAAAEATFAGGFGLVAERRFEADYGDFAASALYRGGREVLALMTGRSETSAVSRRMRGMITPENPRGEGFYLASWAARDPSGLSERVERAGGLVARQHHSFFIHPRSTHGVHMRIYPAEA
ncbi:MAG: VOC family protein [Chloroflexi bacterium]|nr:VOC family protein [Chloroflexota bacterium]